MKSLASFMRRFQGQDRVGYDVGSTSLKVVDLQGTRGEVTCRECFSHPVPPGDADDCERGIIEALAARGFPRGRAALLLDHQQLQVRQMEFAKMPARDLKMAIRWKFRDVIEGPLEAYRVGYTTIRPSGSGDERQLVLAYGVPHEVVALEKARAKRMGLQLAALEPPTSALMAALDHAIEWPEGARIGLLDIGYAGASLLVAADRVLLTAERNHQLGLRALAKALVGPEVSEVDRRTALMASVAGTISGDSDLEEALEQYCRKLLLEIEGAIDRYVKLSGLDVGEGLQHLYIAGGGAMIPNLIAYLKRNLGVPTHLFDPFARMTDGAGHAVTVACPQIYAVAVGLALPQA